MTILIVINFLFLAMYMFLGFRLIRPFPQAWDVLEFRLNLAPYYFKFVGILLILAAVAIYVWVSKEQSVNRAEEILLYHLNLGFLLLVFSKERNEDELFNHIRLKAIVASLIGVIICFGVMGPSMLMIEARHHEWILSFGAMMVVFYLLYLIYFYYSKFKAS